MTALTNIAETMNIGAENDRRWKLDAERLMTSGVSEPKRIQELVNEKASDFGRRAGALRTLTVTFRSAADEFFDRFETLIELQIRAKRATREQSLAALKRLFAVDEAAKSAREVYEHVARSVSSLRPPTREFKRQQRQLTARIEQLGAAIALWLDRSQRLRERLEDSDQPDDLEPQ